jgi:hypothetical protein
VAGDDLKRAIVLLAVASVLALLTTGCPGTASCKAYQAAGFSGAQCSGREGWLWNGISCIWGRECVCTGEDCQRVYGSQDACETAHIHCSKSGGGQNRY